MFSRSKKEKFTRIFYATDIHGSDICFRKFIGAALFYEVDVLILGGDITGKMIVPIVKYDDGTVRSSFQGIEHTMKNKDEVLEFEKKITNQGYYAYHTGSKEFEELGSSENKINDLFISLMKKTLIDWIRFGEDKLRNTSVVCYITGGNDDPQEVIDLIKDSDHVKNPDNKVVLIDNFHQMVSLGWGNPTPWKTHRECSEEELKRRIDELVSPVERFENCIFNFHVPPIDSTLDTASMLDDSTYPPKPVVKAGQPVLIGAGSKAVRDAVERYQPLLVLCGHIHESIGTSNIGRTLCMNPGSEYGEGILRGAIINLDDRKVVSHQFVAG